MEDSLPYLLHQTRNAKNPDRSTEVWGDGEQRRTAPLFSSFLCLQRTRRQRRQASATRRRARLSAMNGKRTANGKQDCRRRSLSLSLRYSLFVFFTFGLLILLMGGFHLTVVLLMDGSHESACFFNFFQNSNLRVFLS